MLKNMAIHELALLATYWGVTVDTIESVTPDADFSRCLTLKGPSGETFTDFSKAGCVNYDVTGCEGAVTTDFGALLAKLEGKNCDYSLGQIA